MRYDVVIWTLNNGSPVEAHRISGFADKETAMTRLRNIGRSGDYDIDYWGVVDDDTGKRVGQLDIFLYTYRVRDLEAENDSNRRS
jgi:hypothetical protein